MGAQHRGADLVMQALAAAGVRRVFALSGNHIMSLFDAARDAGVELLHVRHEAAAVHMADAWARLTGELGVALVTGGPGLGNAVGALFTSLVGETPVLLLSGHAPLAQLGSGAFQEMPQAALAAPVSKASRLVHAAAGLAEEIAAAARLARSGRPGPVHLALPSDLLEPAVAAAAVMAPAAADFAALPLPLGADAAKLVLAALAEAERPLILAPPALCSPAGRRALAGLAAATGVPVVPLESPRGVNDPALGAFAEVLRVADLLVLAGKPLDYTTGFGRPPVVAPTCRWIVLEPDPAVLGRAARSLGDRVLLAALTDAASAVAALTAAATSGNKTGNNKTGSNKSGSNNEDGSWRAEVAAALATRTSECTAPPAPVPGGARHPAAVCAALQPLLRRRPDTVLVADGGEFGQWAQAMLQAEERVINGAAGAIGTALPFAMAARLARPGAPVLALLGDGTAGFHLAEFETAARCDLPFVAVIGNDARWNAEYQIQLRSYGAARATGCDLGPGIRYDLAAAGLGGHGAFVGPADDLSAALDRALASGKPACVNVLIDSVAAPIARRS